MGGAMQQELLQRSTVPGQLEQRGVEMALARSGQPASFLLQGGASRHFKWHACSRHAATLLTVSQAFLESLLLAL